MIRPMARAIQQYGDVMDQLPTCAQFIKALVEDGHQLEAEQRLDAG